MKKPEKKKVPYYRKPEDMITEEWQIALRFRDKHQIKKSRTGKRLSMSSIPLQTCPAVL